jgi:hypothetical protein
MKWRIIAMALACGMAQGQDEQAVYFPPQLSVYNTGTTDIETKQGGKAAYTGSSKLGSSGVSMSAYSGNAGHASLASYSSKIATINTPFTLSLWLKPTGTITAFLRILDGGLTAWVLCVGNLTTELRIQQNDDDYVNVSYALNRWTLITLTRAGGNSMPVLFYQDGKFKESKTFASTFGNANRFWVGEYFGGSYYWPGLIGGITFNTDVAYTPQQVMALYQQERGNYK